MLVLGEWVVVEDVLDILAAVSAVAWELQVVMAAA